MEIKPIKNERDYEQALRRVEELWDSAEGSAAQDEMDVLATLIEAYEQERYPIDPPDSLEAIKFKNPLHPGGFATRQCLEPFGLTIMDVAAPPGVTRTTVSELVNEKRGISPEMR